MKVLKYLTMQSIRRACSFPPFAINIFHVQPNPQITFRNMDLEGARAESCFDPLLKTFYPPRELLKILQRKNTIAHYLKVSCGSFQTKIMTPECPLQIATHLPHFTLHKLPTFHTQHNIPT